MSAEVLNQQIDCEASSAWIASRHLAKFATHHIIGSLLSTSKQLLKAGQTAQAAIICRFAISIADRHGETADRKRCRQQLVECSFSFQLNDEFRSQCEAVLLRDRANAPGLFVAAQIWRASLLAKSGTDAALTEQIDILESATSIIHAEDEPEQSADALNLLSVALWKRWLKEKQVGDLERAIQHGDRCVSILSEELNPVHWALAHFNLGVFYGKSPSTQEDIEQTIRHMEAALRVYLPGVPNHVSAQSRLMAALSRRSKGNEAENLDRGIACINLALTDPKVTERNTRSLHKSLTTLLTRRWGEISASLAAKEHKDAVQAVVADVPPIPIARLRAMTEVAESFHKTRRWVGLMGWASSILAVVLGVSFWHSPRILVPILVVITLANLLVRTWISPEGMEKMISLPLEYARLVVRFGLWLWLSKDPNRGRLIDAMFSFGSNPPSAVGRLGEIWKEIDKTKNETAWAVAAAAHAWLCLIFPVGDRVESSQSAIAILQQAGDIFTKKRFGAFQSAVDYSLAKAYLGSNEGNRQENLRRCIDLLSKHVLRTSLVAPAKRRGFIWGPALQMLGDAYLELAQGDQPERVQAAIQYYLEALGPDVSGKRHQFQHLKEAFSLARMRSTRLVRSRSLAGIAKALFALPDESIADKREMIGACLLNAYAIANQPGIIRAITRIIPADEGPAPPQDSGQLLECKFEILILLARVYSSQRAEDKGETDIGESLLRVCASDALERGLNANASRALLDLGDTLFKSKRFAEAASVYDIVIRHIETSRTTARLLERRANILRSNAEPFDRMIAALVEAGRSTEAFEYMERGKSLSVSDLLSLRRPVGDANLPNTEKYSDLQLKARGLSEELDRLKDGNDGFLARTSSTWKKRYTNEVRQSFYEVTEELRKISEQLTQSDPSFTFDVERLGNAAIQQFARQSKSALVFFRVTAMGTYVFIVAPSGRSFIRESFITKDVLDKLLGLEASSTSSDWWLNRADTHQPEWRLLLDHSLEFLGLFIERVSKMLRKALAKPGNNGFERVVIIPNRTLSILPLHACWWMEADSRRCLLDDFSVVYSPSISVYKKCFERRSSIKSTTKFVGVFNPGPDGNLAFADWEYLQMRALLKPWTCTLLQGESATREQVLVSSENSNILHFSCHGNYRLDSPFKSRLQLAHKKVLTLRQILESVRLPQTDLVVLSACKSAVVDPKDRADEHYGLPTAFLFAGVPSVWGTFWSVDDLATALLTVRAYENLLKGDTDKATALRDAQLWLQKATAAELIGVLSRKVDELNPDSSSHLMISHTINGLKSGAPDETPFSHPYFWAAFHAVGA